MMRRLLIHHITLLLALLVLALPAIAKDEHLSQIERVFYEMCDLYSDYNIAGVASLVSLPDGIDAFGDHSEWVETNPDTVAYIKDFYSRIGVVDVFREKRLALVITSRLKNSEIEYDFFWLVSWSGESHRWGLLGSPNPRYLPSVGNDVPRISKFTVTFRGYADTIMDKVSSKYPEKHFDEISVLLKRAGHVRNAPGKHDAEQGGARQPATAVDSKSEGNEKPEPESEGRSQ